MREVIVTGKTVEEATEAACAQLGLPREEVSIEILEMPVHRLFKKIPAKVRATVQEPEVETPAEPVAAAQPEEKAAEAQPAAEEKAAAAVESKDAEPQQEEAPVQVDVESNEKLAAAVDYLKEIFTLMGAGDVEMHVEKQGEAHIVKVEGEDVGVLIGHRGETMESLSYLAGLAANRLGGDYLKLGLDVAGYRGKREKDLEALARRMGAKVAKTGRSYAMDPMNPYERRIIHSTISTMEGLRSESKGEGADRRVVIYSTDPNAQNRSHSRGQRGGRGQRGRRDRKSGGFKGERRSSVPGREFAGAQRSEGTAPVAPKRTQVIDDAEGFALYGKIEL